MEFELRTTLGVVKLDGEDWLDACIRFSDEHPGESVFAWRYPMMELKAGAEKVGDLFEVIRPFAPKFTELYDSVWFSRPQETVEAAQRLFDGGLFDTAAVFKRQDGLFVMARTREQSWPPDETASRLKALIGFVMVSCCDPLLGVWKQYPLETGVSGPVQGRGEHAKTSACQVQ